MRRLLVGVVVMAGAAGHAHAAEGPISQIAPGDLPDVHMEADGTALVTWLTSTSASEHTVHFCKIPAGGTTCAAGSERTFAGATGVNPTRPFLLRGAGSRVVIAQSGCCPQHTYRWVADDLGGSFSGPVDASSIRALDEGIVLGPGDALSVLGTTTNAENTGYQLAPLGGPKPGQEATLDSQPGIAYGHHVAIDGAGKPVAVWSTNTDSYASYPGNGGDFNQASSWLLPAQPLAGVSRVRLAAGAGAVYAVWIRDVQHEVARWTGSAFTAGTRIPHANHDGGRQDIAVDPAGGVHVVFEQSGALGNVCYAYSADGATWGAPRLVARDDHDMGWPQIAAIAANSGRVVWAGNGGIRTLPLSAPTIVPNVCGVAPVGPVLGLIEAQPTAATLAASITPSAQETAIHVEYGPTTAYGARTPDVPAGAGAGAVTIPVALAGLAPGKSYHARLVATNASGTASSADLQFRTTVVAVKLSQLAKLPRRCSGRRVSLKLRTRAGVEVVKATLRAGRAKKTVTGKALGRTIRLTRIPARMAKVRLELRLADGRVLKTTKTYRRCGR